MGEWTEVCRRRRKVPREVDADQYRQRRQSRHSRYGRTPSPRWYNRSRSRDCYWHHDRTFAGCSSLGRRRSLQQQGGNRTMQSKAKGYAGSHHHAQQNDFVSATNNPLQTRVVSIDAGLSHAAHHEPLVLQSPQAGYGSLGSAFK
ncbi:hypothetical protein A2U01_0050365, partial [Trifolium medium]|nr:hypothetical protein [Trifolium medium]